jgi:hypothetical protein
MQSDLEVTEMLISSAGVLVILLLPKGAESLNASQQQLRGMLRQARETLVTRGKHLERGDQTRRRPAADADL